MGYIGLGVWYSGFRALERSGSRAARLRIKVEGCRVLGLEVQVWVVRLLVLL